MFAALDIISSPRSQCLASRVGMDVAIRRERGTAVAEPIGNAARVNLLSVEVSALKVTQIMEREATHLQPFEPPKMVSVAEIARIDRTS